VVALAMVALLLAPADKLEWSESHPVGMWVPPRWKVLERDRDATLLVIDGPRLGPGVPRVVLRHLGPARKPLDDMAEELAAKVCKRPGWEETVRTRRRIDPWPAVRCAFRFVEESTIGQARLTIVLLGGDYYALELSAPASHFPAGTYDQLEQSLAVRWEEVLLPDGLQVEVPAGWAHDVREGRLSVDAPPLAEARAVLFIKRGAAPEGAEGPKLLFLGGRRPTHTEERRQDELAVRLLTVSGADHAAAVMMPVAVWDDLFPVMERILASGKTVESR